MALWGGQARPEPLPEPRLQFRPGEDHSSRPPPQSQTTLRGPRHHSPQQHKKEDFRQVKGDVHSEIGLIERGDGLWVVGGGGVRFKDHPKPGPCSLPSVTPSTLRAPHPLCLRQVISLPSQKRKGTGRGRRRERKERRRRQEGKTEETRAGGVGGGEARPEAGVRGARRGSPCSLLKTARRRNMKAPQVVAKKPLQ